jgi:glycogen synthase
MTAGDTGTVRRVLMTADAVGGVWTYAMELAKALGHEGVEVVIARMGPCPSSEQRRAMTEIGNVRLVGRPYRLEWMAEPWGEVDEAGDWLLRLAEDYSPDLIHLNGFSHAVLEWRQPVMVVAHSCVVSWLEGVKGEEPGAEWAEYHERVRAGLRAADRVVAPSRAMLAALKRHYGDFEEHGVPATPVPNGRSAHDLRPAAAKEHFVFTAGRIWDEAKNAAAVAAVSRSLAWPVCLAGDLRRPDGGEADFPGVRYLGRLEASAMASWFGRASIFAHPARYEPFGLTPLEAALSGCALVLGDIPSLREVWDDAALYAPPTDTDALEERLNRLIDDPDLRQRMGERARARALGYSPARMAEGYLRIYGEMATAGRKPGEVAST